MDEILKDKMKKIGEKPVSSITYREMLVARLIQARCSQVHTVPAAGVAKQAIRMADEVITLLAEEK